MYSKLQASTSDRRRQAPERLDLANDSLHVHPGPHSPARSSGSLTPTRLTPRTGSSSGSPTHIKFVDAPTPSRAANGKASMSSSPSGIRGLFPWKKKASSPKSDPVNDNGFVAANGLEVAHASLSLTPTKSALKKMSNEAGCEPQETLQNCGKSRPLDRRARSPKSSLDFLDQQRAVEQWRLGSFQQDGNPEPRNPSHQTRRQQRELAVDPACQPVHRPFARRTSSRPSPKSPGGVSPTLARFNPQQTGTVPAENDESHAPLQQDLTYFHRHPAEDFDITARDTPTTSITPPRSEPPSPQTPPITQASKSIPPPSPGRSQIACTPPQLITLDAFRHAPSSEEASLQSLRRQSIASSRQSRRRSTLQDRSDSIFTSSSSMAALIRALDAFQEGSDQHPRSPDPDVPMFNLIPATPVIDLDETGRKRANGAAKECVSTLLEDAMEIRDGTPVAGAPLQQCTRGERGVAEPHFAETNRHQVGESISSSSSKSSTSSSSFENTPTMSTSSSLGSLSDVEVALGAMIRSLSGDVENPQDPSPSETATLEEELAHWRAYDAVASCPKEAVPPRTAAIGLGFGAGWESPPEITITETVLESVQPLTARRRVPHTQEAVEGDRTPVAPRWSPRTPVLVESESVGHSSSRPVAETAFEASRRSSADSYGSTTSRTAKDPETDSMSDMDDLWTASIAQISSHAASSLVFASPRTVDLATAPSVTEDAPLDRRWAPLDSDAEIGWAL